MKRTLANNPAVVIGFNIHGLAIARSLSRAGIIVHALTADRSLATTATRYATVHHRDGIINSARVSDLLLEFANTHLPRTPAVLFPTNDNVVRGIGACWSNLERSYRLSWAKCRDSILRLQAKSNLASYCRHAGVLHPDSRILKTLEQCKDLGNPFFKSRAIVKPVRPLSGFKAVVVESIGQVEALASEYPDDLPFVIQDYIDGNQEDLYFCSMYLVEGEEVFAVSGRKLCAVPTGTGQGTVMTAEPNREVIELSRRFCQGLHLSGPVAIEYKRDFEGRYWMIEPNVGRTEYCVDLLIQSGVDVPLIEYAHALGDQAVGTPVESMIEPRTWYDTERDPLCFLRHVSSTRQLRPLGRSPIFPYFGHLDKKPLLKSLLLQVKDLTGRVLNKAFRT